jgi:ABC-2 type transport system ATP-binding protein
MITVENLTRKFKDITAVKNISFDIDESEIFGFLGPNGAGKTTTIRMLSTLISPDSGKITIDGKDTRSHGEYIREITGLLTESPGMYEKISAYDNLKYYSSFYNIPDDRRNKNIEKYLKMFDLWERKDDLAGTYSKGMKQKLALSRALIHEPKILLLDEPTAGLDPESAHMVRNFIDSLKKEKTTVFLCTHNLEEASSLSDRVCIIKKKIIRIATLSELQNGDRGKRAEIVFRDDADKYTKLIKETSQIKNIQTDKNKAMLVIENPEISNPIILKKLVDSGAKIIYFNQIKASLEEIYLDLIRDEKGK